MKTLLKPAALGSIGLMDILKGLGFAFFAPIFAGLLTFINSGILPDAAQFHQMLTLGIMAGKGYLGYQLFHNSEGDFLTKEPATPIKQVVSTIAPTAPIVPTAQTAPITQNVAPTELIQVVPIAQA